MNSPLSYVDPSAVESITVYTGIKPVSIGGDSIGGAIIVETVPPQFANKGETLTNGEAGTYYRSNGDQFGANVRMTTANDQFSATYTASTAKSENYRAGGDFKTSKSNMAGDTLSTVSSTRYKVRDQDIGLAWKNGSQLIQANLTVQDIPLQTYPNQRMDMLKNDSYLFNLKHSDNFSWGKLESQAYYHRVMHFMDDDLGSPGDEKTSMRMPMYTDSTTLGLKTKASLTISEYEKVNIGGEIQTYRLDDWWPPVSATANGSMSPNTFWNINDGKKDKTAAFAEFDKIFSPFWSGLYGARLELINSSAGEAAGYSGNSISDNYYYYADSQAFNAKDRSQKNVNVDLSAITKYKPNSSEQYQIGLSRNTRSPNLYERYTWSGRGMASIMNNYVGDGNGYIGNTNLKPEVAHKLNLIALWSDVSGEKWSLKLDSHYSYITNYIDVERCGTAGCLYGNTTNLTKTTGSVNLKYVNQNAEIYGLDLSGQYSLGRLSNYGVFKIKGYVSFLQGYNKAQNDNLYNIMPTNGKLSLNQYIGHWINTAEAHFVDSKDNVNWMRNEFKTGGFTLLNIRSTYDDKKYKVSFGVDNLFNKFYYLPQGGVYLGQGGTMSQNLSIYSPVPGLGRSLFASVAVKF